MKINNLNLKQFINMKLFLNKNSKAKKQQLYKFIFASKQDIDIINLNYTLYQTKYIIPLIIKFIKNKLPILIINQNLTTKTNIDYLTNSHMEIKTNWIYGSLTNFKEIYRVKKHIKNYPDLIIVLDHHNITLKELEHLKIPIISLIDTSHEFLPTYPIITNYKTYIASSFYINLIKKLILTAHTKAILEFKNKYN